MAHSQKRVKPKSEWYHSPGGVNHHYRHRYKFTFTDADYDKLLTSQDGRCAICRTDSPGRSGTKRFFLDHDHKTNTPRGLLCFKCNFAIGLLGDSEDNLLAAIEYLRRAKSGNQMEG